MRSVLLLFLCAFWSIHLYAQSCSIQSDSIVCLGELISFSPNPSSANNSYSWNFGDGSSSAQQAPSHSYSTVGKKTISLTITFPDNTTCTASKEIMVHDLPDADFSIVDSEFCEFSQNICVEDNSSTGSTTNGYERRLILWGDGNINSSTSPSNGDKICYNQYPNPGTYTIDIEIENDKGCEARWEEDIEILEDYEGEWTYTLNQADCKSQRICVANDTLTPLSKVQSFKWDFGDGGVDSTSWNSTCHDFTNPGSYKVKLTVTMKNGCTRTVEQTINVFFAKVEANVAAGDTVKCYPLPFLFYNPDISGAIFFWELYDSLGNFIENTAFGSRVAIRPDYPGDFYVRLKIQLGSCIDTSRFYKVSSLGIAPDYDIFNRVQCGLEDTVYFYNKSLWHPTAQPQFLWRFDDSLNAPNCTTSLLNCNFDSLFHSKHWYSDTGCYYPTLYTYDPVSGCIDSMKQLVVLQPLEAAEWSYGNELPCLGTGDPRFGVNFGHKLCEAKVRLLPDSCQGSWIDFRSPIFYSSTCDTNGWVTVGFVATVGDSIVHRSADPNDFYYDASGICHDTIWKSKWFQLFPSPEAKFEYIREECLPVHYTMNYVGKDSDRLDRVIIDWLDNGNFTGYDLTNLDTMPDFKFTYTQEGYYEVGIQVRDTAGCLTWAKKKEYIGFHNDFKFDSLVCANEEILFLDSVRYYKDTISWWRRTGSVEKIKWFFGDGDSAIGPTPKHSYAQNGIYTVAMITTDRNDCSDTMRHKVYVGGVVADYIEPDDELLCDQITQFFDSSYLVEGNDQDSIVEYVWFFGDGSIESYLKNPFHYYNTNGELTVTHVVKTKDGCTDTASFNIYLNGPQPYFDILSDSVGCAPFTATFKSSSTRVSNYIWKFGDPAQTTRSFDSDTTTSFTYNDPGTYYIYLDGLDSFFNKNTNNYYTCRATYPDSTAVNPILKRIIVLPIPEVEIGSFEPYCVGQNILIWSESDQKYSNFNWIVEGEDLLIDNDTITYSFDEAGEYVIELKPSYIPVGLYDRACFDSSSITIEVTDLDAAFGIERIANCNEFQFIDSSINVISYSWNFDHPQSGIDNFSTKSDPTHDFALDTGTYSVCVIGRNPEGCKDTACKDVVASYYELLKMYNVITPGGDNKNDALIVDVENYDLYDLKIFNRWGEMIFQSSDPMVNWDGTYLNQGELLPEGEYFYVLKYSFECSEENHDMQGAIQLIHER